MLANYSISFKLRLLNYLYIEAYRSDLNRSVRLLIAGRYFYLVINYLQLFCAEPDGRHLNCATSLPQ